MSMYSSILSPLRIALATLAMLVLSTAIHSGTAYACRILPTKERTVEDFELMISSSDHIFVGRVSHILRRKWTKDDTPPAFPKHLQELAEKVREGEDVGDMQYLANLATYAEATVHIILERELFGARLELESIPHIGPEIIPVDLLQPFAVAGHGPCNDFPRTCPWDIASGERAVVALKKREYGVSNALFCEKLDNQLPVQKQDVEKSAKPASKFEAIRPYVSFLNNLEANAD